MKNLVLLHFISIINNFTSLRKIVFAYFRILTLSADGSCYSEINSFLLKKEDSFLQCHLHGNSIQNTLGEKTFSFRKFILIVFTIFSRK